MIAARPHWLVSPAARWGIILGTTVIGAGWLWYTGPVPVVRITTPLAEMAPFWYMLTPFPILGMLAAEWVGLLPVVGLRRATLELGLVMFVLVAVSQLRLTLRLPLSGHALLLSYFVLRRALLGNMRALGWQRLELGMATVLAVVVAYVKLVWWTDPITLGVGLFGGILLFAFSRGMAGTARDSSLAP